MKFSIKSNDPSIFIRLRHRISCTFCEQNKLLFFEIILYQVHRKMKINYGTIQIVLIEIDFRLKVKDFTNKSTRNIKSIPVNLYK